MDSRYIYMNVRIWMNVTKQLAKRFFKVTPSHMDANDLSQTGLEALLKAIKRYDPSKGASFRTYAMTRVHGAMLDVLRQNYNMPKHLHAIKSKVEEAKAQLHNDSDVVASSEIAAAMEMTVDEYFEFVSKFQCGCFVEDGYSDEYNPEKILMDYEFLGEIIDYIKTFPPRLKNIAELYFFDRLTMSQIGIKLDLTEGRISQLLKQIILLLRERFHE